MNDQAQPQDPESGSNAVDQPEQTAMDPSPVEMQSGTRNPVAVTQARLALAVVLLMVFLADVTLYHALGFTGPAAFFIGATVLLAVGIPRRSLNATTILLVTMLFLLSFRLASNGWFVQVLVGFWLLNGLALALRTQSPYVLETIVFFGQCLPGGYDFFNRLSDRLRRTILDPADEGKQSRMVSVLLPFAVALTFAAIFIMANPDVVTWVSVRLGRITESIRDFLFQFSVYEIGVWGIVAWVTGGMLRPVLAPVVASMTSGPEAASVQQTPLYQAFRNTLATAIVMFALYLVFEFQTLWFRDFPDGFYYAGYAHEGAAWLTVALALATLTLSLIFRGATLNDPRLKNLRQLAWFWSLLNLVLAAAVYNRMYIYIDFNGMTRMRTVGLLGITSVIGGFVLVLVKIDRQRSFLWLIRRQLWVLGLAVYIYLVTPVDVLIHRYNVSRVMAGDLAPIVQITGHKVDDESLPVLLPLCRSTDAQIQQGIQAMLSQRFDSLHQKKVLSEQDGWTAWQKSTVDSLAALENARADWDVFAESDLLRIHKWNSLKKYAYNNWW